MFALMVSDKFWKISKFTSLHSPTSRKENWTTHDASRK